MSHHRRSGSTDRIAQRSQFGRDDPGKRAENRLYPLRHILGGIMELLGVVGAARYQARTGRLYVACDAPGGCLMAAVEDVYAGEVEDGVEGTLWLCTLHAAWWRRLVAETIHRDLRQAAKAARVTLTGGRVSRSQAAKDRWAPQ